MWYDENQPGLRLDRGAGVAADPPITDASSIPNLKVQDSETVHPTSLEHTGSVPENDSNPSTLTTTVRFLVHPIDIRKVAK